MLNADHVSRMFGNVPVLTDVSLSFQTGEITALLGPNGSGKSTLFRVMAGVLEPSSGCVHWDVSKSVASAVASMIDGWEPPRWATARRLLDLQSEVPFGFDRSYAEKLLCSQEIPLTKRYGALSKGQRRWVCASLTLATRASCLLLDEPADGLDPRARKKLYDAIRDVVNERECAAVVATHILPDIGRVADAMAILQRGRLVMHESLERLREELCEVEMARGCPLPENLVPHVLGHTPRACGDAYVVRHCGGLDEVREALSSKDRVQRLTIDALYQSLTESEMVLAA